MVSEIKSDKLLNQSGDQDSGIDLSTNDVVAVKIAGSEKARVHSDGTVGLGTSSPNSYDSRANNLVVGDSGDAGVTIFSGATSNARLQFAPSGSTGLDNGLIDYDNNNDVMSFATAGTEHLYITNDGVMYYPEHSTDGATSANAIIQSANGKIERSTASSQKLKENIKDITMDCTKIQNLKVREFDYKSNYVTSTERADIGLIAEEVDAVEPMWTTQGYIDETDCKFKTDEYIKENSKTKHAIDIHWRRLQVGMLKEIQRLHTEIETLKTKVAALEAK